jgi:hypothetical protein
MKRALFGILTVAMLVGSIGGAEARWHHHHRMCSWHHHHRHCW